MVTESHKEEINTQLTLVARSIGNGNRLEILDCLTKGLRTAEELAVCLDISVANTYKHLQVLKTSGLVKAVVKKEQAYFQLTDVAVVRMLELIYEIGEGKSEQIDLQLDHLSPISKYELLDKVSSNLVTVIDVRSEKEFLRGHIPSALNIPLSSIDEKLKKIYRRKEVIAYCRGPYCTMAYEAVIKLRNFGFRARHLEVGFPEWKLAGLPVEEGFSDTGYNLSTEENMSMRKTVGYSILFIGLTLIVLTIIQYYMYANI